MNPQLEMHLQEFERAATEDEQTNDDASEQHLDVDHPQLPQQLVAELDQQAEAMDALLRRAQILGDTTNTRPFERKPPKAFLPRMLQAAQHYGFHIAVVLLVALYKPAIRFMGACTEHAIRFMGVCTKDEISTMILLVWGTFWAFQVWMCRWERNNSKNRMAEAQIMLPDDYESNDSIETDPLHVCRLELSRLLGSIGAPFLSEDHSSAQGQLNVEQTQLNTPILTAIEKMKDTIASPNDRTLSPSLLIKVAHINVQLIQTYDDAMETMKMGTALHLGATTRTAERVERALFGRRAREQQKKGTLPQTEESSCTDNYPVSFGSLRSLVSRAMIAQADALHSILAVLNDSCRNKHDNEDEPVFASYNPLAGGLPSVVSLTWLRSSRQQLSEFLSHVLEELATCDRTNRENIQDILVHSVMTVEELQQHLQSSLGGENEGVPSVQQKLHPEEGCSLEAKKMQERVIQTQLQLQQLYVALGAMNETSRFTGSSTKVDTIEWWDRVNQLSQKVQTTMQLLDQEYFQPIDGDVCGEDKEDTEDQSSSNHVQREQSYTMEANAEKEQQKPKPQKLTKTSVFAGKGAKKPPKLSPRNVSEQGPFSSDSIQTSATALPQSDPIAQHFLLSELRTRLQTLSLPEEEHEVNEFEEDYEMVKSGPAPAASAYVEKTTAMPSFSGLLVGELSNAVKLLGNHNESDDEEALLG